MPARAARVRKPERMNARTWGTHRLFQSPNAPEEDTDKRLPGLLRVVYRAGRRRARKGPSQYGKVHTRPQTGVGYENRGVPCPSNTARAPTGSRARARAGPGSVLTKKTDASPSADPRHTWPAVGNARLSAHGRRSTVFIGLPCRRRSRNAGSTCKRVLVWRTQLRRSRRSGAIAARMRMIPSSVALATIATSLGVKPNACR